MSLIKKPSELATNNVFKVLIYGQPGAGKSTIALSCPNPVLLDFDGGANRINAAHQVPTLQVNSWEDVIQVMSNGELAPFSTIVIDTAGKMLDYISAYVMKCEPKFKQRDGTLSLKGFGARKVAFQNFINQGMTMNKNLMFLAHEKEDKDGDKRFIRPEIGSASNQGDLIKELDLVGYMRMNGYQREICWTGTDQFYAKNACNLQPVMAVPQILDANGLPISDNNFMTRVFDSYNAYLTSQRSIRAKYDALMARVNELIAKVDSVDVANDLYGKFMSAQPVWNSKVASKMALDAKCASLGYKFNEMNNVYEVA